jgi:hypothetical protein
MDTDKLKSTLGLDEGEICNIVIALGYTDTPIREKKRKDISQTIIEI